MKKNEAAYIPAIPLRYTSCQNAHICRRISTRMFTVALFTMVKKSKRTLSMGKGIKDIWHVYTAFRGGKLAFISKRQTEWKNELNSKSTFWYHLWRLVHMHTNTSFLYVNTKINFKVSKHSSKVLTLKFMLTIQYRAKGMGLGRSQKRISMLTRKRMNK